MINWDVCEAIVEEAARTATLDELPRIKQMAKYLGAGIERRDIVAEIRARAAAAASDEVRRALEQVASDVTLGEHLLIERKDAN